MPRYKRTADEAQLDVPAEPQLPAEDQETLRKLRNMWEFASLMQYIFLFGHVVKIDEDFDIEDLEAECLKPAPSERLARIGLQLLKYVSSHRGLTPEIFDEYARRQYTAKAPQRNPFGEDEDPIRFNDMDIYSRIQILQQLSTWTLGNAERMRGLMPQDEDHLNWRMEPLGWDKEDRSYYVLDDNRLYRRSDVPVPPPSPKSKSKAKPKSKSKSTRSSRSRGTRSSKRRKIEDSDDEEAEQVSDAEKDENADDTIMTNGDDAALQDEEPGYGFTSRTWECIAISLDEYQDFMATIFRSRDPNEKALRTRIEEDVLPIIEKRAEALLAKQQKKLREIENLQKMATAKRSSRLADKADKEKQEREEREAEEKRKADLRMAKEEQERQKRIEEGHESRRLTREQRVREREAKRILHEEELARLDEEGGREQSQAVDSEAGDAKRASERQRITQREQHKKELEKLAADEGTWYFDCSICGKHGENMDDGSHSIACDKCSVWQHSKCHGFSPKQAESETFTFVCNTCKRKEEDAQKPKIAPLKLTKRSSGSPEVQKNSSRPTTANSEQNRLPDHVARQLDNLSSGSHVARPSPGPFGQITNGPSLPPHGQAPAGYRYPPVGNFAPQPPQQAWQGNPYPPAMHAPYAGSPPPVNGHQQQHQYAHQSAIASAGGHPGYYQHPIQHAQPPRANGYTQSSPGQHQSGQTSTQRQPPQQYTPQHYGQYQQHQQPPQYPNQQLPHPGSSHLMNGFQSPQKAAAKPVSASPPVQAATPNKLHESPKPNLQPSIAQPYEQRSAHSPVKQSPQYQPPPMQQRPSPAVNGTSLQPSQFHTPQMQRPVGESHSNNVAADGMSGPWPEGSKAIPQKHDQSPAPPSSAQAVGEKKVFPPNTPLVPSPNQNIATGADSIPIKKLGAPTETSISSQ